MFGVEIHLAIFNIIIHRFPKGQKWRHEFYRQS